MDVTIETCQIDDFDIVEVALAGGATVAVGPVMGIDGAAIGSAIAEAGPLLGINPSDLTPVSLESLLESMSVVEEVFAASANTPPIQFVDYLGDPSDYSTWIAIGTHDVEVVVSLATVTQRSYRVHVDEVTGVPLPSTGILLFAGLPLVAASSKRRRSRRAKGRRLE